ncbi:Rieske (2Fe-2S) protein [Streptacidiphilus sp. P02-A3a]|uniref:Rieske (2Fe-2S) protein n=1 Tax=Streptacidiphilus sp. P02-A3a TaxID=2704468 RepID=UPI0015FC6E78|nr:Rieske (2Fe-2S) protein [Streptacidiphilus sp. P02-A3a]QMU70782.1 Rieske (2Fe-2S) protein [Streptacidiphilus sp. P02-A3a]
MQIDQPHEQAPARRTVLAGTGVVAAAALLTACGAGGGSGSGSGAGSSAGSSAGGTGTTAEPGGGASGSAAAPQGLTATSAVPVGGGLVFKAQKVVVTQPTPGEFKCFTAVCTHQGCIVGSVADGLITCPCHGSQYRVADGSVARGPAPTALAAQAITVSDGEISLAR